MLKALVKDSNAKSAIEAPSGRNVPRGARGAATPSGSEAADRLASLERMVDDMPINIITCDLKDFRIDYANKAALATLRRIEHLLPIKADELIG